MKILIAGAAPIAARLVDAAERAGIDASTISSPEGRSGGVGRLARLLLEIEGTVDAERPRACLLADDGDAALAEGLVAAKAELALGAAASARSAAPSGRVIAQLAEELPADDAGIVAWIRARTA